jgi:hypothetical protein
MTERRYVRVLGLTGGARHDDDLLEGADSQTLDASISQA